MKNHELNVRNYSTEDYPTVKKLYEESGWFDPEMDKEERLKNKSERDPDSLLVATDTDLIVGTLSLIEDGRIALFFRLVTADRDDAKSIRSKLMVRGEVFFQERGYSEAHIIAPEGDIERQKEYEEYGFKLGNPYRWMWKELK